MKTKRIGTGHYETEYKGHTIELINLEIMGGTKEWIAPINGENDIEPVSSKKEALELAIKNINLLYEE